MEASQASPTTPANANPQTVSLNDLLELAISSQDVGTVNFNILRLLLDDMVKKLTKIDKEPIKLGDHDANQVANYKNYMDGAPVTPMPGIMKYPAPEGKRDSLKGPGQTQTQGGPVTPRSARPPAPTFQRPGAAYNYVSESPRLSTLDHDLLKDLQGKITHLEQQLNINHLPDNLELLHKKGHDKEGGMSVNDMWQLIQLNNRIAAAEAAIQKMASLIEDLAKELNHVRGETTGVQANAEDLAKTNSKLAMKVSPLSDKCEEAEKHIDELRHELEGVKEHLGVLGQAAGLDPANIPSFMKIKHGGAPKGKQLPPGFNIKTLTPQQLALMTPSTFALIPPQQIAEMTPSMLNKLSPQQFSKLNPNQVAKMTPQQLAQLSPAKMSNLTAEQLAQIRPSQMEQMPTEQRNHLEKLKKEKIKRQPEHGGHEPGHEHTGHSAEDVDEHRSDQDTSRGPDVEAMTSEEIARIPISELKKLSPTQINKITPSKLEQMSPDQRRQVERMKKHAKAHAAPDLTQMTGEEIAKVPVSKLRKLNSEQLAQITPSKMEKMTPEQRKQVEKMKAKQKPNFKAMNADEIAEVPISEIAKLSPSEARHIPPSVMEKMTPVQLKMLERRKTAKRPTVLALKTMSPEDIALIPIDDLNKLTPNEIQKITPSVLELMTSEQRQRLDEIKGGTASFMAIDTPNFDDMTPSEIAGITISTFTKLSPAQLETISDETKAYMTPEQLHTLDEMMSGGRPYDERGYSDAEGFPDPEAESVTEITTKKRKKPKSKKKQGVSKPKVPEEPKKEDAMEQEQEIPEPELGEHMEILTMEGYLASLPQDQIEDIAADAVQAELQKQYAALQGMQNQLARDIQDKMEVIYQKLLREIITQQLTTSPYTVIDGHEKCLGPGVCKGHGMPAGIAVCQYPDAPEQVKPVQPPGQEIECPTCGRDDALKKLKRPRQGGNAQQVYTTEGDKTQEETSRIDVSADLQSVKEMKEVVAFDLEKIRNDLRNADFGEFDEKDMLERMGTLWEAVKVLKANEDTLSSRILRNENMLKKLPSRMGKGLEDPSISLTPLQLKEQMMPSSTQVVQPKVEEADQKGDDFIDKDDIQTLFNNLANVIAECADQKERIDQIVDAVRIIESGMVTKQFLVDMISDKADRGQINTKVSYDEFGNTVDELHAQLHNLMVEGYQRNENWKKVTADLAEELAEKLDKVELAPIRAFFKSRLKKLEDRVMTLSALLEEPDPAGTRKKLLRDYNCISCDRHVHISGGTNAPTLPTIGPVVANSSLASHRALDLHRLRTQRTRFDADGREMAALEKQLRSKLANDGGKSEGISDKDMMQLVNRYTGSAPVQSIMAPMVTPTPLASQAQQQIPPQPVRSRTSAATGLNIQPLTPSKAPSSMRALAIEIPMEEE